MAFKRNGGDGVVIEPDPATWPALEEKFFIHLMVKEVHKGNRSATTFSRKGWKHIEQEFLERTGKRYSNSQFRNKFNQLRNRYYDFSKLLKEPGFRWDPVLNNVTAAENIWEAYIKANRTAKRFRKKGCPMFSELEIIYGGPASKCKNAVSLAQYPLYSEDKLDLDGASTNATPSIYPSNNSSEGDGYPLQQTTRPQRHRSPTSTSHIGGKREARERTEMSDGFKESDETTKAETLNLKRVETWHSNAFSITKCVKYLESIEGLDGSTYLKAINMFKDVDWREMFMAMSAERKLVWLASL